MDVTDSLLDASMYKYYENRLRSFDAWSKQLNPDKYDLAKAGFYYTGYSDRVVCFRCRIRLKDWARDDVAAIEHEKWSPDCEYVRMTGVTPRRERDSVEAREKLVTLQ